VYVFSFAQKQKRLAGIATSRFISQQTDGSTSPDQPSKIYFATTNLLF